MKTRITELLGIEHPIIQCGMILVSLLPLAVAASKAGALGIMTSGEQTPEELRQNIRKIRELTDKPFGVNLVPYIPGYPDLCKVVVEENVPVFSHGFGGNPFKLLGIEKPPGMVFMPTVGTVGQAIRMEREGADAVIVTGMEGGGHVGNISTMVLVGEAVERLKIPVVASGGFCDGRGLAAALALGAEGIAMGTRFVMTQECPIAPEAKQVYIKARDKDALLNLRYDGLPLRSIKGEKVKRYRGWWSRPWEVMPSVIAMKTTFRYESLKALIQGGLTLKRTLGAPLIQYVCGGDMMRRGLHEGDTNRGIFPAGQIVGHIKNIPTCQELVEGIVAEAEQVIETMGQRYAPLAKMKTQQQKHKEGK